MSDNKDHLRNFAEGLNQSTGDNNDLLRVLTCESVSQYLTANKTEDVDFIVFFVNQDRFEALTEVTKDHFLYLFMKELSQ